MKLEEAGRQGADAGGNKMVGTAVGNPWELMLFETKTCRKLANNSASKLQLVHQPTSGPVRERKRELNMKKNTYFFLSYKRRIASFYCLYLEPGVLLVPVLVLGGAAGVRDPLDGVDDGAGEVVGGVGLVLGTGAVVRGEVHPVHDGVSHRACHTLGEATRRDRHGRF